MSNCPKCGNPLKLVPAGVSKNTGKPYEAFWACQDRNCKFTAKQQVTGVSPVQAQAMAKVATATEDKKWEEISRGKVRHGFAIEAFKLGMSLDSKTANKILEWTEFVMSGKLEEEEFSTIDPQSIPF